MNLSTKVSILLTGSMIVGAAGTFLGASITSPAVMILLAVLFLIGIFPVHLLKDAPLGVALPILYTWVLVSGLFMGPAIAVYVHTLGWQTVMFAYLGTGAVMAFCGVIGAFSGINFRPLENILGIALLALIILGIAGLFFQFSHAVNLLYAVGGMVIFSLYFVVDFFRLSTSDNTWGNAITVTVALYLDFINFLLFLLRFLAELSKKN